MFMPRTVSAIRINQQLTPLKSPSEGANPNMLAVHDNVPTRESHENAFRVLMKGRITPSGPSHRGHTAPIFTRRHLFRIDDIISFQELISVPSLGVSHR
ncbi:hypothetical protein CRYUN_Cryun34aG0038900 [Craigia yunnanensis]